MRPASLREGDEQQLRLHPISRARPHFLPVPPLGPFITLCSSQSETAGQKLPAGLSVVAALRQLPVPGHTQGRVWLGAPSSPETLDPPVCMT